MQIDSAYIRVDGDMTDGRIPLMGEDKNIALSGGTPVSTCTRCHRTIYNDQNGGWAT